MNQLIQRLSLSGMAFYGIACLAALPLEAADLSIGSIKVAVNHAPSDPIADNATTDGTAENLAAPGLSGSGLARQLAFIERHYQDGDRFRAESEMLRFLQDNPGHPAVPAVELARAKLYHQEGRHRETERMLVSFLDRYPDADEAPLAGRLLGFSRVLQGEFATGATAFLQSGGTREEVVSLGQLLRPPANAPDPDLARTWSTVLPGSGFFEAGRPGTAMVAISLNLVLAGGAVIAYRQDNLGAALLLLLAEIALYSGGRDAARDAAQKALDRIEARRRADWVAGHGEPELLRVGLTWHFGGDFGEN